MTDVEKLRDYAGALCEGRSDAELALIITGAKSWIGGIRWSWLIVSRNFLRDGRYHAGFNPPPDPKTVRAAMARALQAESGWQPVDPPPWR